MFLIGGCSHQIWTLVFAADNCFDLCAAFVFSHSWRVKMEGFSCLFVIKCCFIVCLPNFNTFFSVSCLFPSFIVINMSARLRVILQEEIHKLSLPSGFPQTVDELKYIVKETFKIEQDFSLPFQDQDFDGQFFTLLKMSEIKDKDTIKVFFTSPVVTLLFEDSFNANSLKENSDSICTEMSEDVSSCSSLQPSDDTIILSSPETILQSSPESTRSLCSSSWPAQFTIPTFSFDTELILQAANEAYRKDGTYPA